MSNEALLAEALNFLDDTANASHLTWTKAQLWAGVLAAVGGEDDASNMSVPEMMAAVWNELDGAANVSHRGTKQTELLAGIVNALDGDANVSHLTSKVSELYQALADAAEVYAGEGGGGAPEWVPENAVIHIDLVGGSPQGRAWTLADGEVAVSSLLGTDANTVNGWGATAYDPGDLVATGLSMLGGASVAFIGAARTALLNSATVAMRWNLPVDASFQNNPIAAVSTDGVNGFQFNTDFTFDEVESSSVIQVNCYVGDLFDQAAEAGWTVAGENGFAFTITATRFEAAVNGLSGELLEGTFGEDERPAGNPFTACLFNAGRGECSSITIYEALPDTTGLSALSAVA